MWFGMLHLAPEQTPDPHLGDQVLLMVWKPDWTRAITVVCPADIAGSFIRLLRAAAAAARNSLCGAGRRPRDPAVWSRAWH